MAAALPEPLAPDDAARLTDFARACKAAARIVSLYPPTHPAIQAALARVELAGAALALNGAPAISVLPDGLRIDGRAPHRPDAALGELAALLHGHLVGELTLTAPMEPQGWHRFLRLLARPPEDVRAEGGLARAWLAAGGGPIEIKLIDYGEILRERAGGLEAAWERLIANYLEGEQAELSDEMLAALRDIADDPDRFAEFAAHVLGQDGSGVGARGRRSALLVRILRRLADFVGRTDPASLDRVLEQIAALTPHLHPEAVLELATGTADPNEDAAATGADVAAALRARVDAPLAARFVASAVAREHGATARLAEAFRALVPDEEQRHRVLGLAAEIVAATPFGQQPGFRELWQHAADLLQSYSDEAFVSAEYGRELSTARAHAVDVERIADDPPERIGAWVASVSDDQLRKLDQQLLRDLLAIETQPDAWRQVLDIALTRIDQFVLVADLVLAQELLDAIIAIRDGGSPFHAEAALGVERLLEESRMRHVVLAIRQADERDLPVVARFCHTLGPQAMRPLAEALVVEEHARAVRRLREVLLGFGAAGRAYANELRNSANPNVRRTAIELLRAFGGDEALPDLAELLDDAEPQVQREALRAIVQIGTDEAYATLHQALSSGSARSREAIMHALGGLRDTRAAPLFSYMLRNTSYRGALEAVYCAAVESLGHLRAGDPESLDALRAVLYRGDWWAPRRTARLRQAAAAALRAVGTPEAEVILNEAVAAGPAGTRRAARAALAAPAPRPRRPA